MNCNPRSNNRHFRGEKWGFSKGGCRRKPLSTTTPESLPRGIRTRFRVYSPRPPRLCTKMCSRPCLRKPTRYKRGGTDLPVPPTVSYYLQLLPIKSALSLSDSKSRGRKAVRVRPPPPAPGESQRPTFWLAFFFWPSAYKEAKPFSWTPVSRSPGSYIFNHHFLGNLTYISPNSTAMIKSRNEFISTFMASSFPARFSTRTLFISCRLF